MPITEPLSLPSSPTFRTSGWTMRSQVGISESIYTFEQQASVHPGQKFLIAVELPKMRRPEAAAWAAFFAKCNGRQRRFLLADPAQGALLGVGGGTPVVAGANQTGNVLNVSGLPEAAGVWLAGDFIQIGSGTSSRRYMIANDVAGTGSPTGEAAVDIWPRLRESPANGAAIVTADTKGLFRLAQNEVNFDIDQARNFGFAFAAEEAF